jgi:hypothetical protein
VQPKVYVWKYENDGVDVRLSHIHQHYLSWLADSGKGGSYRANSHVWEFDLAKGTISSSGSTYPVKRELFRENVPMMDPYLNMDLPVCVDQLTKNPLKLNASDTVLTMVDKETLEYEEIARRFMMIGNSGNPTMEAVGCKINSIERVFNSKLAQQYEDKKRELDQGEGVHERLLFNGSRSADIGPILQTGIDKGFCSQGHAGIAIYLSSLPSYSRHFAHGSRSARGHKEGLVFKMFVVKTLVGKSKDMGHLSDYSGWTKAPFGYDSINYTLDFQRAQAYAVYDNAQCYITHVVTVEYI